MKEPKPRSQKCIFKAEKTSTEVLRAILINSVPDLTLVLGVSYALSLYKKDAVLLKDGTNLGTIENFILNLYTRDIDFLVVPKISPKLVRDHAGTVAGTVASQAVGRIKDVLPTVASVSSVTESLSGPLGGIIATDVRKKSKEAEEEYYLVPAYFISDIKSESVTFDLQKDFCREWLSRPALPQEVYAALLDGSSGEMKRMRSSFRMDLGLSALQGTSMKTAEGGKLVIVKDIQIDIATGRGEPVGN